MDKYLNDFGKVADAIDITSNYLVESYNRIKVLTKKVEELESKLDKYEPANEDADFGYDKFGNKITAENLIGSPVEYFKLFYDQNIYTVVGNGLFVDHIIKAGPHDYILIAVESAKDDGWKKTIETAVRKAFANKSYEDQIKSAKRGEPSITFSDFLEALSHI